MFGKINILSIFKFWIKYSIIWEKLKKKIEYFWSVGGFTGFLGTYSSLFHIAVNYEYVSFRSCGRCWRVKFPSKVWRGCRWPGWWWRRTRWWEILIGCVTDEVCSAVWCVLFDMYHVFFTEVDNSQLLPSQFRLSDEKLLGDRTKSKLENMHVYHCM